MASCRLLVFCFGDLFAKLLNLLAHSRGEVEQNEVKLESSEAKVEVSRGNVEKYT